MLHLQSHALLSLPCLLAPLHLLQ
uniref:Uncharacterized protein n=1 Tax=Rhizophora mucronata TaxID=61149 RepID=A0A2P2PD31_RHIMU